MHDRHWQRYYAGMWRGHEPAIQRFGEHQAARCARWYYYGTRQRGYLRDHGLSRAARNIDTDRYEYRILIRERCLRRAFRADCRLEAEGGAR